LFIWRLKIEKPEIINLTLDTMGMNNNEAKKRQGVEPTYKKYLGFQPLQIIWKRKIVDAIFRGGKKHSNYGNTAVNIVTDLVKLIRKQYDPKATIILRIDSGFFDEANLEAFNKLKIGVIYIRLFSLSVFSKCISHLSSKTIIRKKSCPVKSQNLKPIISRLNKIHCFVSNEIY